MSTLTRSAPTRRTLAILRAVAAGRATLTHGREPDLFIDGIACCDQFTAHGLVRDGLIAASGSPTPPGRAPAVLTDAGAALLAGQAA